MNVVTIMLSFCAIIVILASVIYVLFKQNRACKKEISSLNREINSAHENVKQLTSYIRNLDKIRKDEQQIADKIKDAKTDEEVYSIINDIIAINNNRMQND